MRQFLSLLKRFRSDERGAFLALFGVLAIVLIATSGAVFDYTTVTQARARAQVALDAAALALQPKIYVAGYDIEGAAEDLLINRIGDPTITVVMETPITDPDAGSLTLGARVTVPLYFVALVGISTMSATVESTATRGSHDVEVAVALDITWSMNSFPSGGTESKIASLRSATNELIDLVVKDQQTPTYSKMALIPYSNGVNVGTYAVAVRGPVTDYTPITAAEWLAAPSSSYSGVISAINTAIPGPITTSTAHGFVTGDVVNVSNVAGGDFIALNNRSFTITVLSTTTFTLNGVSTSAYSGTYTASSGLVTMGTTRLGSAITKANPAQITTTMDHGLNTGDFVHITSAAGGGFTALNSRDFTVTRISATVFSLNGLNSSSYSGTYTANSAIIRKCQTNECEVVVTSAAHGLADAETSYITNVSGMTQLNGNFFTVSAGTTNTYVLEDSDGPAMSAYTSGGSSYCTRAGCQYYYFQNANGGSNYNLWPITTCATERVGAHEYDDERPGTTFVGRNYTGSATLGQCPNHQLLPLTSDNTALHTLAGAITPQGSTAGQIGLAWSWYMLSEEFTASLTALPAASMPEAPNDNLIKVLILMTDGAFNTGFCNGVTSRDYGVLGNSDSINCTATNGNPFTQAASLCTAIKKGSDGLANTADDIIVYTVAFDLGTNASATSLMADCATDADHAHTAADGDDLSAVFNEIGNTISALRISN